MGREASSPELHCVTTHRAEGRREGGAWAGQMVLAASARRQVGGSAVIYQKGTTAPVRCLGRTVPPPSSLLLPPGPVVLASRPDCVQEIALHLALANLDERAR